MPGVPFARSIRSSRTRIQRLPYTIFDAVVLISMADLSLCLAPEFIACFDSPIVRADSLGATGDPDFPRGPPIRILSHPRPADPGPPSGASNAATPTAGSSHEQHRATMP